MKLGKTFFEYMAQFLQMSATTLGIKITFLHKFFYILEMRNQWFSTNETS
jgi:hypothetical protein